MPSCSFLSLIQEPGKGGQLVRSAGNSAQLMAKEGKYATLRLPSGGRLCNLREIRTSHISSRRCIWVICLNSHDCFSFSKFIITLFVVYSLCCSLPCFISPWSFKRNKDGISAKVIGIEYDPNRSANIALICYEDGQKAYILAPEGLTDRVYMDRVFRYLSYLHHHHADGRSGS